MLISSDHALISELRLVVVNSLTRLLPNAKPTRALPAAKQGMFAYRLPVFAPPFFEQCLDIRSQCLLRIVWRQPACWTLEVARAGRKLPKLRDDFRVVFTGWSKVDVENQLCGLPYGSASSTQVYQSSVIAIMNFLRTLEK